MRTKKDVDLYTSIQTIITEDGEVIKEETNRKIKLSDEPKFVKLYIDFVLSTKELSQSLNPILLAFISYMNYASQDEEDGGQVIFINSAMKNDICKKLNIKIDRVNQSLQQFKKAGIFKSLARGKYQVNPNYFGRGEWKDIKKIKGSFEYSNNGIEIKADIEHEQEDA